MDPMALLVLAGIGLIILMLPVLGLIAFAFFAVVIFVWRKLFPLGWGIAEWVTNRRNLIPFVLFLLIVIAGSVILVILSYIFALQVHWVGYLFLLLFLFVFFVAEIIFWGGIGLAVILWIVRLSHWAYALFRRGFWRTFRPGGPPDFQPVPVPLTNPLLVAPPRSKHSTSRRRQPLTKRRKITTNTLMRTARGEAPAGAEEQAQVKKEAKRRQPVARRRQTSPTTLPPPSNEKALAKEEAEQTKIQAKEDARQAKIQAKEDAKRAKAQAKEDAKQAKIQAKEEAEQAKIQAKEAAEQAKIQAKEEANESTKIRRKRRLKRND